MDTHAYLGRASSLFSPFRSLSFRFCFIQHGEIPVQGGIRIAKPCLALQQPRCAFRGYHPDIKPLLAHWFNALAVSIPAGDIPWPLSPEAIDAEYERCTKRDDRVDFIIYERESCTGYLGHPFQKIVTQGL